MDLHKHKRFVEISIAITEGEISQKDLTCPYCGKPELVYSYTQKGSSGYGLFIECKHCGHREHFLFATRPQNYSEDKIIPEYQDLEDHDPQTIKSR